MLNRRGKNLLFGSVCIVGFAIAVSIFIQFSIDVKKNLVWFNNSDQNAWVIYSSLDFNDGNPTPYISHPGIGSSFVFGTGFKILHTLGVSDVGKTSDLKQVDDPLSLLPDIYRKAGYLSIGVILLCALLIGNITYLITNKQIIYGIYSAILTLFSGGFLFHSVMLRNELSSTFYFLISLFIFCILFYKKEDLKENYSSTLLLILSGFFLGLSYFSKSQIILSAILFFAFAFYLQFEKIIIYRSKKILTIIILIGHVIVGGYLWLYVDKELPFFWIGILLLFIIFSLISLLKFAYSENYILSFASLLAEYSLGFSLSILYVLERGLKGGLRSSKKVLEFTSLYTPNATSIQTKTIDPEFSRVLGRFYYFLQHYFLESLLLIVLVFSIYLLFTRQRKSVGYLLAIVLILGACFLNSLRANLAMNVGRAIFKYIIFIDVAVVLLSSFFYYEMVKRSQKKYFIHLIFWSLLIVSSIHNYKKVKKDVNWTWTTFADMVYPERWLYPGTPPEIRKILKSKYKGEVNGHDRVVFGDELKREKEIYIPGGANHLRRIHKLSMEPYWNRLRSLLRLNDLDDKENIHKMEKRVLEFKIRSFIAGDDYKTILDKTIRKRRQLYQKILNQDSYSKYITLVEQGRITVPF